MKTRRLSPKGGSPSVPAVAVAATYSPTMRRQASADQSGVHGMSTATPRMVKMVSTLTGLACPPLAKAIVCTSAPPASGGSKPSARGWRRPYGMRSRARMTAIAPTPAKRMGSNRPASAGKRTWSSGIVARITSPVSRQYALAPRRQLLRVSLSYAARKASSSGAPRASSSVAMQPRAREAIPTDSRPRPPARPRAASLLVGARSPYHSAWFGGQRCR